MTDQSLRNCAILVVEDEYLLADDLCGQLTESDAIVIGPAATVEEGQALLRETAVLNGAVLDVNLRGEPVFPLADELAVRQVPFLFTTGYDAAAIPKRFQDVPRCEKPLNMSQLVAAIRRVTVG